MRKLLRSNCPIPPQQDLFQQGPEFNDTGKMKRKKRGTPCCKNQQRPELMSTFSAIEAVTEGVTVERQIAKEERSHAWDGPILVRE